MFNWLEMQSQQIDLALREFGFVSCISNKEEKQEILNAMATAAGFFRKELAKRLRLRHIPELSFQWDDSIEWVNENNLESGQASYDNSVTSEYLP